MNKFMIVLPNSTPAQRLAVNNLFPPQRAAWWHWSPEVWLVSFPTEIHTSAELRDEIKRVLPGNNVLVLPFSDTKDWAGWGPQEWQEWFNRFWK